MTYTKNEKQTTSLQLTKESAPDQVKNYFQKIFELKQSGKEFPINLDDAWALAYNRKQEAVRSLKTNFVESVHYQVLRTNAQNSDGGRPVDEYWLSVECLEYFIASRIQPVFDVYRKVFHATIEGSQSQPQLSQSASAYQENIAIPIKMGITQNYIYVKEGVLYARFSFIMKFIGYTEGSTTQYVDRIGRNSFIQVTMGKQQVWFINAKGVDELLLFTRIAVPNQIKNIIYRDLFGIDHPEWDILVDYSFTKDEMLAILEELNHAPINRVRVTSLLFKGKK